MGGDVLPEQYEQSKGFQIAIGVDDPLDAERIFRTLAATRHRADAAPADILGRPVLACSSISSGIPLATSTASHRNSRYLVAVGRCRSFPDPHRVHVGDDLRIGARRRREAIGGHDVGRLAVRVPVESGVDQLQRRREVLDAADSRQRRCARRGRRPKACSARRLFRLRATAGIHIRARSSSPCGRCRMRDQLVRRRVLAVDKQRGFRELLGVADDSQVPLSGRRRDGRSCRQRMVRRRCRRGHQRSARRAKA